MDMNLYDSLPDIVVPIFICVVLPIAIVWIAQQARQNAINKKTEVLLKAIEAGIPVDLGQPEESRKTVKSIKKELLERFTGACVTSGMGIVFLVLVALGHSGINAWFSYTLPIAGGVLLAVGIALFISYFVGKKMLAGEIEAEEKALTESK